MGHDVVIVVVVVVVVWIEPQKDIHISREFKEKVVEPILKVSIGASGHMTL